MISSTNLKIIFLDFDGVLDTAFYDSYLEQSNMPSCDDCGRPIFDPVCIGYLKQIVERTSAQIVVSSDWKYYDSLEDEINAILRDMEESERARAEIESVTYDLEYMSIYG